MKEYIEDGIDNGKGNGKVLDNYLAFQNKVFVEAFGKKE
jgi:hypothetical protein